MSRLASRTLLAIVAALFAFFQTACTQSQRLRDGMAKLPETLDKFDGISEGYIGSEPDDKQRMLNGEVGRAAVERPLPPPKHLRTHAKPPQIEAELDEKVVVAEPAKPAPVLFEPKETEASKQMAARIAELEAQVAALSKPADASKTAPKAETVKTETPKVEPAPVKTPETSQGEVVELKQPASLGGSWDVDRQPEPPAPALPPHAVPETLPTEVAREEAPPPERKLPIFTPDARALRDQARNAYLSLVEEHPESEAIGEARLALAQMALEDGHDREALMHYERLLSERPQLPAAKRALLEAGRLNFEQGQYEKAREQFESFAYENPKDPQAPNALLDVARTFEKQGQTDKALAHYKDVIYRFAGTKASRSAQRLNGDLLLSLGRYDEARKAFTEIANDHDPLNDNFAYAELQIVRSFLAQERPAEARKALQRLLGAHLKDEDGGEAYYLLAQACLAEDRPFDAARAYLDAVTKYPKNKRLLECHQRAGEEFAALEMHDRAAEQFSIVLKDAQNLDKPEKDRILPPALMGLAHSLRVRGEAEPARVALKELRTQYPEHRLTKLADFEEAELMVQEKHQREASALLGAVATAYPETPLAVRALVRKAEIEEHLPGTTQLLDTLQKINANDLSVPAAADYEFRRGMLLASLNRGPEALRIFRHLEGNPSVAPKLALQSGIEAGQILERDSQIGEAIAHYEQLVAAFEPKAGADQELKALLDMARWKVERLKQLESIKAALPNTSATENRKPANASATH